MNHGPASRIMQQPLSVVVQSSWVRLCDWVWYFTPGILCCMLCWSFSAALTLASVQVFWQRKSASQHELDYKEAVLSAVQTEALTELRARFWQQGVPALTLTMPARAVIGAALASLAARGHELTPSKGIPSSAMTTSSPSPDAWDGLLWLDQVAVQHGLVVDLLRRVAPEAPQGEADTAPVMDLLSAAGANSANRGTWVALDLRLAGTRLAVAGFLEALAASPGTVRAEHFTIDVAAGRADLRLLYNLQRPPAPATLAGRPSPPTGAEEPSAYGEPLADKEPSASKEPSACEQPSAHENTAPGQATLWRTAHVSAWWRQPDGEVTRTPMPGIKPGSESSERSLP